MRAPFLAALVLLAAASIAPANAPEAPALRAARPAALPSVPSTSASGPLHARPARLVAGSVNVTPASGTSRPDTTGRGLQVFTVENTGSAAGTFTLSAICVGAGTACSPSVTRMVLEANTAGMAAINYTLASNISPGTTPAVRLVATLEGNSAVSDTGAVTLLAPSDPLPEANEGDHSRLDRGVCVAAGAGAGAAFECGDLRLAHALPGTRNRNRSRAPVLLYNSQHARPYPIVSVDVAPAEGATPDTIRGVLQLSDGTTVNAWWPGWSALPTSSALRRIAVGLDGGTRPTGVYGYTLTLTAKWNGGASEEAGTFTGRLVIVNRKGSEFGAGWWLAGLERIWAQGDGSLLWVGGDGSHHLYAPDPANAARWGADPFAHPDSIVLRTDPDPAKTRYARILPGRAEVRFDTYGRHRETVSATGDTTYFAYDAEGRLDLVTWSGAGGNGYDFRYSASGAPLSSVGTWGGAAGTERVVSLQTDGGRRVTSITDPDNTSVVFGYPSGSTSAVVASRTDRMGAATSFIFDSGNKLWRSTFALTSGATSANDSINIRFTPVETRGLGPFPVELSTVFVAINGPRTDVNDIHYVYVNRYGAPIRVIDPGFGESRITYGDPRWPGLATRVRSPDGREVASTYDARGNLQSTTDLATQSSGRYATTLYRWDPYWDRVVQVTAPEGEATFTGVDAKGRVAWVQPGYGSARRTNVAYLPDTDPYAPGLVSTVTAPGSAAESYQYDARGNLAQVTSPTGQWTMMLSDRIGRDTAVRVRVSGSTVYRAESMVYDSADRVKRSDSRGPALNGAPAQTLTVTTTYDLEGRALAVSRWATPDSNAIGTQTTTWKRDLAGRAVAEYAPDGARDSTVYDPAGNAVRVITRRGHELTMEYDLFNRLTKRRSPAVTYAPRAEGLGKSAGLFLTNRYPYFPNAGDSLRIAADSALFTYDLMGRLRTASNGDAVVRRGYWPNGLLRGDTLQLRTVAELGAGGSLTQHVYGIELSYDLDGRRTQLKHPGAIAPTRAGVVKDRTYYAYDPATGAPREVTDPFGNPIRFHFNVRGDLDSLTTPGVTQTFAYDDDGRRTFHGVARAGATVRAETFGYDDAGKLAFTGNTAGTRDTMLATYNGLGHLFTASHSYHGVAADNSTAVRYLETELPRGDALGNQGISTRATSLTQTNGSQYANSSSTSAFAYAPGSGRLRLQLLNSNTLDTLKYDAAGNTVFTTAAPSSSAATARSDLASFYDAEGRLRASEQRTQEDATTRTSPVRVTFEEHRYDPLGRRVLTRVRRACIGSVGTANDFRCAHTLVRRTVWDGDQELYEIQQSEDDPENDTSFAPVVSPYDNAWDPNPMWGRVAYTSGVQIDQPLGIIRMRFRDRVGTATVDWEDFALFPLWNSRGQVDRATFEDGTEQKCGVVGANTYCVPNGWPGGWFPYNPVPTSLPFWQGTAVESKRDQSGLLYRRNRYYDPKTGRFTQEDPIGIAGGLNVYGFGAGDPVTYSDPYGLCPPKFLCDLIGATAGEEATRHWADVANNSSGAKKVLATGAGLLAALWTPDTYQETFTTLEVAAGAGSAVQRAGPSPAAPTRAPAAKPRGDWTAPAGNETRVSRWMSEAEYTAMRESGTLQVGANGRTYITSQGAPKPGGVGPVRVDFNVPTSSLQKAGQPDWFQIINAGQSPPPINGIVRVP